MLKRYNISGTMMLVVVLSLNVVAGLLYAPISNSVWADWLYPMISEFLLVLFLLLVSRFTHYDTRNIGFREKPNIIGVIITTLTAFSLYLFGMGLSNILSYALEWIGYIPDITIPSTRGVFPFILTTIALCVMPALCEETVLRGCVLPGLRKSYGTKKAILFSALAFALMHGNVAQLFHQFALGVVVAILVLSGKSLWYGVIFHFINNFLSILLVALTTSSDVVVNNVMKPVEFFSSPLLLGGSILLILIGGGCSIACVLFFVRRARKMLKIEETGDKAIDIINPIGEVDLLENKRENIVFWTSCIVMTLIVVLNFIVGVSV